MYRKVKEHGNQTHGLTKHYLYNFWSHAKQRCFNPKNKSYKNYGGRGITMIPEWSNSFVIFYEHAISLENAFKDWFTLDRKENNGDYVPGNLRWANKHIQSANRRCLPSNKSGYTGVTFRKARNRWIATLVLDRKRHYIGTFDTPKEAAIARYEYIITNELFEYPLQILTKDGTILQG